ncbi:hypothetical protein DL89DRAFT_139808 [Linderina pennispora]|uniref:Uncharacterized protein n=1 Tax=Linderina pennispora TaxID=61395 RepID=A0A1Y1WC01_9FUNG|nr:uncharacterized protein DL89DRAFT_139808 [Linderina pennispora]ORX70756.1 hypothetical protein DL89DRAFT_139808 [Linderina pennispora]
MSVPVNIDDAASNSFDDRDAFDCSSIALPSRAPIALPSRCANWLAYRQVCPYYLWHLSVDQASLRSQHAVLWSALLPNPARWIFGCIGRY